MGHAPGEDLDPSQVQAFLASRFDPASRQVAHVGAGAWSRCFGFHRGEQELVVRFGQHVDDFRKDQLAAAFRTPELPIPTVLAIGVPGTNIPTSVLINDGSAPATACMISC